MNKQILLKIIATILTIAIIAILLSYISTRDVVEILTKINPLYLAAGLIFYAASYLLRALRLHILLNKEIGIIDLFSIVCIHTAALNVFPARSGELSYIYLLKTRHNKSAGEGAASLILIRTLDFITISLLFSIVAFTGNGLPSNLLKTIKIIGVILFIIILIMLVFIRNCDIFVGRLESVSVILSINKRHFVNYLFRKMDEMSASFKKITFDQFVWSIIISTCIWSMSYSTGFILIKAMGINIAFDSFLLAFTFFLITTIIPIQGIGGFGTLEGGWTISFMAVGIVKEVAISSGIIIHIISIIYMILLFLIGFLALRGRNCFKSILRMT